MTKRIARLGTWLLVAMFGLILMANAPVYARQAVPQSPSATPDIVVDESLMDWTIGGSMLYWGDRCPPGPDIAAADVQVVDDTFLLRRTPLNGGFTRTLDSSTDADCGNYQHMVADETAIYFYNVAEEIIESVSVANPTVGPVTVASVGNQGVSTDLMVKDGSLYYGTSDRKIMRVPVGGGAPELVVASSHIPRDIEFLGSRMYWSDNAGVWSVTLPCNGCTRAEYSNKGGAYLLTVSGNAAAGSNVYWVVPGNGVSIPTRIYTQVPVINGVADQIVHSAPLGYSIGDPISVKTGFLPGQTSMYWTESHRVEENFVRRDGAVIAAVGGYLNQRIQVISGDIYFARVDEGNQSILRIPADADALTRDMSIAAIEVTQAVQNLENGVPLIAGKETYARVYGRQISGDLSGSAEAWLEGSRNGQPLPGSPLRALNGVQPLITGQPIDRGPDSDAKGDWLFRLPDSWNDTGDLELRAIVDPRGAYEDTNPLNNTRTTTVAFTDESDPCLVVYPIQTHAPLPQHTDPILWETLDRLVSLWPINGATVLWMGDPIRELELCWDWDGHCWGPYEMDQGWEVTNFPPDSERVLAKLMLRQALSQIQSIIYCDDSSSVHTVGMVQEESDTGNTGGYANFLINASWVKFDNDDSSNSRKWNQPTAGMTLAQELTHNFWRYHIGCEDGEDSFFGLGDWPYADRCKLDDRPLTEAATHYGFDPISHQIIRPDQAGDFMTYRSSRWVSDFTFKDVKSILGGLFNADIASNRGAAQLSAQLEGESLLLSGVYESNSKLGRFFYSYVLPNEMLTDVATGGLPTGTGSSAVGPAHIHHGPLTEPDAHVRLLGRDGKLLAEHQLDLVAPDSHEADYAAYYFLNQIPKPAEAIGEIQLVVDGKLVHSVMPSAAAPVVDILTPAANDSLGEEITIRWRATDADSKANNEANNEVMLFSINYSRDGGMSWLPLVTEYPGDVVDGVEQEITSLTLESPETVPGSDGNVALLRVIASDGFNTTVAEAGPFTVEDRAPIAMIQAPAADEWFETTETILLRGVGYDAEGGLMGDGDVEWSVDGAVVGSGRRQSLLGLAPGVHSTQLKVTDSAGQTATKAGTINVLPLSVETATSLRMDGRCNDNVYVNMTPLPLAPYASDGNASAYIVRRADDLWVCLSGLARDEGVLSEVRLHIDANGSRDAVVQTDDYLLRLGEDGSPQAFIGNGSGVFGTSVDIDFDAQIAATDTAWSAEFRIPSTSLMLWNGTFGLAVNHSADSQRVHWPFAAGSEAPNTWAAVASETIPIIQAVSPDSLTVGDQSVVLTVEGIRFGQGAALLWNGVAQTTVISDTDRLTVALDNALLQSADSVELTVVNVPSSQYASNPAKLLVQNKRPSITDISPNSAELMTGATSVTITGQDFVAGTVAIWDGQPRPTRFVSATRLEMDLAAADFSVEQALGVTALPPEPRRGASNTVEFVVGDPGAPASASDQRIYLPAIMK